MAFAASIKALVSQAMQTAADLAPAVTYRAIRATTYNPATGNMVETYTDYTVKAVLTSFRMDEKDRDIVIATDMKCLIAAADLPVTPGINDRIINGSKTYNVVAVKGVPGDSLHIIHVREV